MQEGKEQRGKKGGRELLEKVAGDEYVFIPGEWVGLADESGSEAMLDAGGR
jgi:hypothetical protein